MPENNRLYSYNYVIRDCSNDYVILLNNDVRVSKNYLAPLLKYFDDRDVFAVMPRIDSGILAEQYISRCVGEFRRGTLGTGRQKGIMGAGYSLYVHCASVYDRKKFIELGGLDKLYWPEYFAEADICYLAWLRGWKVLFEPESSVFHVGDQTIGKGIDSSQKVRIHTRGGMIFFLKNITDKKMLASWAFWSFLRFGRAMLCGNKSVYKGYLDIFRLFPVIIARRKHVQALRKISDREILLTLQGNIESAL